MTPDVRDPDGSVGASKFALLLHPHPSYGGSRHHPFVAGLFERLPDSGVGTLRFDFSTPDPADAAEEVRAALAFGAARWPGASAVLVGYSFGAAVAATVADPPVAAWYLLAPPEAMLAGATIGSRPGPKTVVVPEHDQFSSMEATVGRTAGWAATTVTLLAGVDHFLGPVTPSVDMAVAWVEALP